MESSQLFGKHYSRALTPVSHFDERSGNTSHREAMGGLYPVNERLDPYVDMGKTLFMECSRKSAAFIFSSTLQTKPM
jgi:hypothetical protein